MLSENVVLILSAYSKVTFSFSLGQNRIPFIHKMLLPLAISKTFAMDVKEDCYKFVDMYPDVDISKNLSVDVKEDCYMLPVEISKRFTMGVKEDCYKSVDISSFRKTFNWAYCCQSSIFE